MLAQDARQRDRQAWQEDDALEGLVGDEEEGDEDYLGGKA